MANTSCSELAERALAALSRGQDPLESDLVVLAGEPCSREFFRVIVEGLADQFEPRHAESYARVMARVLAHADSSMEALQLVERHGRLREPREYRGPDPACAVVLSRVTLGADVAITSRVLDAAKRRFPDARVLLAGSRKAWELFEGDPRVGHLPVTYPRAGSLGERLAPWRELQSKLPAGALVMDPDSRITQLGMLPVGDEERYLFFDSRSFGGDGSETLGALTERWCRLVLGVDGKAYLRPAPAMGRGRRARPQCTISLGVGENRNKRVGGTFEEDLLREVLARGFDVTIDKGAGGEEAERVERAIAAAAIPDRIAVFDGAFAPFAAAIMESDLYVGYDSAGQHVAAAAGVPLVSVFAGYPCERMFQRWRPSGHGRIEVVKVERDHAPAVLEATRSALDRLAL